MAGSSELQAEVDDLVPLLDAWSPFLQDGTMAQDLALAYGLPFHSLMMNVLWSDLGEIAMIIALIVLVAKFFVSSGTDAWKFVVGFVAVVIFAWPVDRANLGESLFHKNYDIPVQLDPNASSGSAATPRAVSLGVAAFLYVFNYIDDALFSVVSLTRQDGDPAPLAAFQAMSMAYNKLFEEPALTRPVEDYYKNCAYLRNDPSVVDSSDPIELKEWMVFGLGGIPTFGYEVEDGEIAVVENELANSFFGQYIPGIETGIKVTNSLSNYVSGRSADRVKMILQNTNPMRSPDTAINNEPYRILTSDYWRERARADGGEVADKKFLKAGTAGAPPLNDFFHPVGGDQTPDGDLYANNCYELFQIADLAWREMREGVQSAFVPAGTSDGYFTPRGMSVFGASNYGMRQAAHNYYSNFLARSDSFGKMDPNLVRFDSSAEYYTPGAVASELAGLTGDLGIWAQEHIKLPDVIMMTVGGVAILITAIVIFLPIILAVGMAAGSVSVVSVPLRGIIMFKLVLILMFLFLKMGAGLLETLSLYWRYSEIVDQTNVYPMLPLFYAAHNGTLFLTIIAPPVIAYMIAFQTGKGFGGISFARPGATNVAAGTATAATAGVVAGGLTRGIARAAPAAGGRLAGPGGPPTPGGGGGPGGGAGGGQPWRFDQSGAWPGTTAATAQQAWSGQQGSLTRPALLGPPPRPAASNYKPPVRKGFANETVRQRPIPMPDGSKAPSGPAAPASTSSTAGGGVIEGQFRRVGSSDMSSSNRGGSAAASAVPATSNARRSSSSSAGFSGAAAPSSSASPDTTGTTVGSPPASPASAASSQGSRPTNRPPRPVNPRVDAPLSSSPSGRRVTPPEATTTQRQGSTVKAAIQSGDPSALDRTTSTATSNARPDPSKSADVVKQARREWEKP